VQKVKIKKYSGAALIFLMVILVCGLLAWWNPLEKQQLYLSNFLYYERPTDHQVVVVSIDDQTVSEDGLGKFSSWCRTNYIPVLEKLAGYKPAVIGVDIFFTNKSKGICGDDLNKITVSENPRSELNKYIGTSHPNDVALGETIKKIGKIILLADIRLQEETNKNISETVSSKINPIPEIISNESQIAQAKFLKDKTDLIRNVLPIVKTKDESLFSLSILAVLRASGINNIDQINWNKDLLDINAGDKELKIPLDNFRLNINFTESPKTALIEKKENAPIIIIPFIDLYKSEKDFSFVKDKIVLVGQVQLNSGDNYFSPIDTNMYLPGVMIHAQAIQTILDQAWLRNITLPEQIGLIALMAALALLAIFGLRIVLALPLLGALVLAYGMAAAPLMFRTQGVILNLVYPPLAVIISAIAGYAYRYVTEFRQKKRVAGALGQYVNTEVARQVLESEANQVQTGGVKHEITVVFTDIRGFTSISESLSPQSTVTLLNEYFEEMSEVIFRNGGIVDKYEGDALMAFFEDLPGLPDQACRAAQSALEMRAAVGRLNARWKNDGLLPGGERRPQIDFRTGISTGEALVGNIGSSRHIQYTVIGDIVNLGSRLESANKSYHTSTMISEATYLRLKNCYDCRFVNLIRVKGKDHPVKVYELLAPKGQLTSDMVELILGYNKGLALYFERKFPEALEVFQKEVLARWPADYLTNVYAGKCEMFKKFPPRPDWDFVHEMTSK
jgi:adenylate cyclase